LAGWGGLVVGRPPRYQLDFVIPGT
jgi:hypothetical protein